MRKCPQCHAYCFMHVASLERFKCYKCGYVETDSEIEIEVEAVKKEGKEEKEAIKS